ncbi:protein-glutamate methylesterase/protein-glutamine glutaminase [Gemmatimonas groenlandica]|uniref:Protein-glutamate methylesterase/protein-glutamine glutaminase n=1 Tax=Gemmatimonas groenlandica TaxID=2732249 RepID=A0A6M4IN84_9BACT|nr:chemotaxis response regulator protein-glutamate methylesterase [Gemmatimonas groenlandica]QJR36464.1 chemotaxis response regulator protein-glutamate methylesterase [Gemmatimonas groenlandica]
MRRIRVLVVDDSVVVRRLVTDVLSGDPDIEVVGIAANGRIALQKIAQLAPDLVTLDIEMPEMDGLTTISEIRKTWTRLPVIMFSTLTARGAEATLEALSRGATDYVTKPANVGSVTVAQQRIRDDLIPKIRSLCASVLPAVPPATPRAAAVQAGVPAAAPASGARSSAYHTSAASRAPIGIVAIGSSTGGPNALLELIPRIPADFPVPIVITQHMPPMFTKFLADRLTAISQLPVREATEGAVMAPGTIWIAPGDFHLVLRTVGRQIVASITKDPPENSCRPAVDVMLRSVVSCYGPRVLSVILTGMGQDGLRGSEGVHDAGGSVIAQDEATSVVWGMPGFVARSGIASAVLPLPLIAQAIIDRVTMAPSSFRVAPSTAPSAAPRHASPPAMSPGVSWQ